MPNTVERVKQEFFISYYSFSIYLFRTVGSSFVLPQENEPFFISITFYKKNTENVIFAKYTTKLNIVTKHPKIILNRITIHSYLS